MNPDSPEASGNWSLVHKSKPAENFYTWRCIIPEETKTSEAHFKLDMTLENVPRSKVWEAFKFESRAKWDQGDNPVYEMVERTNSHEIVHEKSGNKSQL